MKLLEVCSSIYLLEFYVKGDKNTVFNATTFKLVDGDLEVLDWNLKALDNIQPYTK